MAITGLLVNSELFLSLANKTLVLSDQSELDSNALQSSSMHSYLKFSTRPCHFALQSLQNKLLLFIFSAIQFYKMVPTL